MTYTENRSWHASHAHYLARALCLLVVVLFAGCGSSQIEAKKRKDKADFHYKLAAGYFHAHSVDLAIQQLVKAFQYDVGHADSRYLFGFIHFGRKRYEEAVLDFKRALKRRPQFFAARNHLGVTYLELERWQDAIDVLKPLLKQPTYTTPYLPYNNIGWAYLKMGRLAEAGKHLRMAVFINPRFCQGHRNLGLLAEKRGDRREAQRHLEVAVKRCPKVATFHFSLGNLYCRSHQGAKAEASYKQCQTLAGGSLLSKRCAARVDLAHNGGCQ
ncbi:MAG: tetratricopeptide repeat protein [Myxococcales bacterium]|nr:tetratricopeptide repeat protein [Myxococcales bacterium]